MAGTTGNRSSYLNANEIARLGLQFGYTVYVEKGGVIIPKVTGVDLTKRVESADTFQYIQNCPECNTELIRKEGEAVHYCPNAIGCPPQIQGRIEHFIHRNAMNIESLGPETIKGLLDNQLISNYADLYQLTFEKINGLSFKIFSDKKGDYSIRSLREKSAKNIIDSIEKSKKIPFPNLLFGLGIRYVGKTVAEKLAEHFLTVDRLASATLEEQIDVNEIGERIAISVRAFFDNENNCLLVEQLKDAGLQLAYEVVESEKASDLLGDKTFVISGVFENYSRDALKEVIIANGGKIVSSISGKLDFLVAGDKMGPSKLEKANKFGTKIISEKELEELINNV